MVLKQSDRFCKCLTFGIANSSSTFGTTCPLPSFDYPAQIWHTMERQSKQAHSPVVQYLSWWIKIQQQWPDTYCMHKSCSIYRIMRSVQRWTSCPNSHSHVIFITHIIPIWQNLLRYQYQWQTVRGDPDTFWYFGNFLTIWAFLS